VAREEVCGLAAFVVGDCGVPVRIARAAAGGGPWVGGGGMHYGGGQAAGTAGCAPLPLFWPVAGLERGLARRESSASFLFIFLLNVRSYLTYVNRNSPLLALLARKGRLLA
jgi:hypothetical protein